MSKHNPIRILRNQCDALIQEIGLKNNKKCFVCLNRAEVMHHFILKSLSSALRYDFRNLIPLCNLCHFRNHKGDFEIAAIITQKKGKEWLTYLKENRRKYVQINLKYYQNILTKLKL